MVVSNIFLIFTLNLRKISHLDEHIFQAVFEGDPDEAAKWLQAQWLEKGSEKAGPQLKLKFTYGSFVAGKKCFCF